MKNCDFCFKVNKEKDSSYCFIDKCPATLCRDCFSKRQNYVDIQELSHLKRCHKCFGMASIVCFDTCDCTSPWCPTKTKRRFQNY